MSCCICSLPARGALCGHCAADPDATARHICDVLALCEQTHTRLLAELSADDTRRFLNVKRARRAAAAPAGGWSAPKPHREAPTIDNILGRQGQSALCHQQKPEEEQRPRHSGLRTVGAD